MKRYKVIALSVGGRGKKIFDSGDIVNEDHFIPGRAEELVQQGFLAPLEPEPAKQPEVKTSEVEQDEEKQAEPVEEKAPEPVVETSLLDALKENLEGEKDNGIDSITRKQLIKELTERGIDFNSNAAKKELYALWLNHKS